MNIGSKIPAAIIVLSMLGLAFVIYNSSSSNKDSQVVEKDKYEIFKPNNNSYDTLTFDNFLVEEKYTGEISKVNFDTNKLAEEFASVINASVSDFGVNYAGRYSVVTWGCGVKCQNSTIVDVSDGTIVEYGLITSYGLAYSSDSKLLIVNPEENLPKNIENETSVTTDYYLIDDENHKLTFIEKTIPGRGSIDVCIQATASAYNFLTDEVREFSTPCKIPSGWKIIGGEKNTLE